MNYAQLSRSDRKGAELAAPFEIIAPDRQRAPLVFASPHSGNCYPSDFVAASRLDHLALRRSEDSFVDEIFREAPALGAPLLRALFPRAYVDPNREPFELDPMMFEDRLPAYANTRSPRVAAGLGTIARVVANGAEIYNGKLTVAEALTRIRDCYWPYHTAVRDLVNATKWQFGYCILVDCHSMPSIGGPMERDAGRSRVDFVLGDGHGTSCDAVVVETVESVLRAMGYVVTRNVPYSGGFVTRHYGRPKEAIHALQIEINRGLYMDEGRIVPTPNLGRITDQMRAVIAGLAEVEIGHLSGR